MSINGISKLITGSEGWLHQLWVIFGRFRSALYEKGYTGGSGNEAKVLCI